MKNIFFVMSLSSSFILGIYYLFYFIFRNKISIKSRRTIILLAIIFAILPIPYFKYIAIKIIWSIFPVLETSAITIIFSIPDSSFIFYDKHNIFYSNNLVLIMIIYGCFLTVSFIIILHEMLKYYQLIKIITKQNDKVGIHENKIIDKSKKQLEIRQEIKGITSTYITTPMTAKIFHPVIILPKYINVKKSELKYLIYHEMVHIKHKDVFLRFLGLFIIAIHWYNPFSYLLFYTLNHINELYSDEIVTANLSKKEKYSYCNIMISLLENDKYKRKQNGSTLSSFIGNSTKKQLEERIDNIMRTKKEYKFAGFLMGVFCIIGGSIISFLYQPPKIINAETYDTSYQSGEICFTTSKTQEINLPGRNIFINQEGNIENIQEDSKAICIHKYVSGTQIHHSKNKKGGCVSKYYNAKRCTICGRLNIEDLIKTEEYVTCPH